MRRLVLLAALAAAAAGCITPPVVFAAGSNRVVMRAYPPRTEGVEVPVGEGVALRGVFVPSDPGAPVVLVFLGSGDSVSVGGGAATGLAWDLRDRGFASLILDYRGVGPSDGERSPWNLRGDARAAYDEAVRRAGGEERVLVRGMSLGTLAAAALLDEGRRPAAVVLVVPVRAETVAENFAFARWWDPLVFLAAPFLRDAGDVDLVGAVRACPVPLLALCAGRDDLLPPGEMALVREACLAGGERTFAVRPGTGHETAYLEAVGVFPEERALLARLFPALPPVEERVRAMRAAAPGCTAPLDGRFLRDPPALGAALAEAGTDGDREKWIRGLRPESLRALPWEALRALVDFRDPAGDLDPRELYAFRSFVEEWTGHGRTEARSGDWARVAAAFRLGRKARWTVDLPAGFEGLAAIAVSTESHDLDAPGEGMPASAPRRLLLPAAESQRQAVRLLLKAAGIPDRPTAAGGMEAWEDGAWRAVDLP